MLVVAVHKNNTNLLLLVWMEKMLPLLFRCCLTEAMKVKSSLVSISCRTWSTMFLSTSTWRRLPAKGKTTPVWRYHQQHSVVFCYKASKQSKAEQAFTKNHQTKTWVSKRLESPRQGTANNPPCEPEWAPLSWLSWTGRVAGRGVGTQHSHSNSTQPTPLDWFWEFGWVELAELS